jgi:hypothetical protein
MPLALILGVSGGALAVIVLACVAKSRCANSTTGATTKASAIVGESAAIRDSAMQSALQSTTAARQMPPRTSSGSILVTSPIAVRSAAVEAAK